MLFRSGLLVEKKDISLSDLKGTFDVLAKKLFGENCVTRFRPSYYQFTEPSVEQIFHVLHVMVRDVHYVRIQDGLQYLEQVWFIQMC